MKPCGGIMQQHWPSPAEPGTAPGRLRPEPSPASRLVSACGAGRLAWRRPGADRGKAASATRTPAPRLPASGQSIQTGLRPLWFAPNRFAGAPPGRRSVLNACSARERRPVTQGALQARAAALSRGGPCPRCAAGRASHPFHPCFPFFAPVFHDGTGTASKTDQQPGGNAMHTTIPPQTPSNTDERDAAIQIIDSDDGDLTTCHGCIHLQEEGDGVGWCEFHCQYRSIRTERQCAGAQFFPDQGETVCTGAGTTQINYGGKHDNR